MALSLWLAVFFMVVSLLASFGALVEGHPEINRHLRTVAVIAPAFAVLSFFMWYLSNK